MATRAIAAARRAPPPRRIGRRAPPLAWSVLGAVCAAKLALHVASSLQRYGYFRDELYYLALARHPAWGYVDCAPLVALYARVALAWGGSLAAVRLVPALAGTALVALTMLLARELGGRAWAQMLAGLTVALCPGLIAMDSYLSMNAFEPLFWMGGVLLLMRILEGGRPRLWIWFGVVAGIGLENKHSMLFFGFAAALALLATRHRRVFRQPGPWIAAAIALLLFLPNLAWQVAHHFPTLQALENVRREGKNTLLSPGAFVWQQIVTLDPLYFPLWAGGLGALLLTPRRRVCGLMFVALFLTMLALHGKVYYTYPMYPLAFAAGAVALERGTRHNRAAMRAGLAAAFALAALPSLPFGAWVLPAPRMAAFFRALPVRPKEAETHVAGPFPQNIGDQFGWPELVGEVAALYRSLPPDERAATGILAGNYGEAAAVDFFGPALGLPHAWSGHQNYWYWGPPATAYRNLIGLQWPADRAASWCRSYTSVEHFAPYGMAEENKPIYLCRGLKVDLRAEWPRLKHWN